MGDKSVYIAFLRFCDLEKNREMEEKKKRITVQRERKGELEASKLRRKLEESLCDAGLGNKKKREKSGKE